YTWDQRTELLEGGTVKDTRVEMVNWVNGAYQRSLVSNEGPSLPRFGIRKRIAEGKQKEMQQYMSGLKAQLEQDTLGTSPQVLGFFNKAAVSGPDATGLIALSGGSVVMPGDSMTVWVNAATKKAAKAFVATTYQGDSVTMNATFNTLPTGLDYVSFADIQIPGKSMEVQSSTSTNNKNNGGGHAWKRLEVAVPGALARPEPRRRTLLRAGAGRDAEGREEARPEGRSRAAAHAGDPGGGHPQ